MKGRNHGVPVPNVEGAASSTISTFGDTPARRVGGGGSSLLPKCREEVPPVWGNELGPTVFLWDGLDKEGREECDHAIQTRKDWVVWSRARPMKGDRTPRGFEHVGKTVCCGKANRSKKEHGEPEEEEGMEDEAPYSEGNVSGYARRQRGWWKRGVVETELNTVNMKAWVHKECDIMDQDALRRLQEAWESPEQKDECVV